MHPRISPRPLLGILAVTEHDGLIEEKSATIVLVVCFVQAGSVTGDLAYAETEHQKLTMDPRRTPEKVLTGHLCDQMADFTGNPRAPTAPATPESISPQR
jgi:hypothetical protein